MVMAMENSQGTMKPSERRQTLCASISTLHLSSPLRTTHSSLTLLVSGHEQQIFFPDFPTWGFEPCVEERARERQSREAK